MTDHLTSFVVPVDLAKEEMRVLTAVDTTPGAKESTSPEFLSLAGTVVVNLITAATVVGWIDASSAAELAKSASAVIAAIGVISVNGMLVWKYIASRTAVKTAQINAQYRYMEVVAAERFRASV